MQPFWSKITATNHHQQFSNVVFNRPAEDATWKDAPFICAQFPDFLHSLGQECPTGLGILTYRRTGLRSEIIDQCNRIERSYMRKIVE